MGQLDDVAAALADRYAIEQLLGEGGMATVYQATDLKHHRKVAVKVLRPDLGSQVGAERFLREIRTTASLRHAHVLPLYDSGEAGGLLYYVMPFVAGETLKDRLQREGQLPIPDAVEIACEVADALGYAHSHGVVHRDVKPANILLDSGHAVVADFGIARVVEEVGEQELTETGVTVGTPAYMSPEQAAGNRTIDARSDIYSLGCVLYEMLAGQPPYPGNTASHVIRQHLAADIPSVAVLRPSVEKGLAALVARSLAKAPADRFPTAQALAEGLRAPGHSPSPDPGRHRRHVATIVATAAIVAVGGWGWWTFGPPASGVGGHADVGLAIRPYQLVGDTSQSYLAFGLTTQLRNLIQSESDVVVAGAATSAAMVGMTELEVGSRAGMQFVLDGIVQTPPAAGAEAPMLVTTWVTRTEDGLQVWSATDTVSVEDFSSLHAGIARRALEGVGIPLGTDPEPPREVDPNAYRVYLRARFEGEQYTPDALERATNLFQEAINLDPGYAPAHSGLAWALMMRGGWWGFMNHHEAVARSLGAAHRALDLDTTQAEAYATLAKISFVYDYDWAAADSLYQLALHYDPNSKQAHGDYAHYLRAMVRFDEALAHMERTVELDRWEPMQQAELSLILSDVGLDARADSAIQRALELAPEAAPVTWSWGRHLLVAGRTDEALSVFEETARRPGGPVAFAELGMFYALHGRREDAYEVIGWLEPMPAQIRYLATGLIYAALGDIDQAAATFEQGIDDRTPAMALLGSLARGEGAAGSKAIVADGFWDAPRIRALLDRMDYPWEDGIVSN